jgi:S-(hydroxymethyl)glutathione dehydrogenase / alcohol dehydrogenase
MYQADRKYYTISIHGVYALVIDKFSLGQIFNIELQIDIGKCPFKKYYEQLLHLIEVGRIRPKLLISHRMKLDDAPKAYEMFDRKKIYKSCI